MAVLWAPVIEQPLPAVRAAARVLGIELIELQVTQAGDIDHAFETARRDRAGALIVLAGAIFFGLRARIADLALHHRLPAIGIARSHAHSGGLVSYGQNDTEYYRRAAVYVDKILKGAKPGDLPVEQPTKFELVINLKTARTLGLDVPVKLLALADAVIE